MARSVSTDVQKTPAIAPTGHMPVKRKAPPQAKAARKAIKKSAGKSAKATGKLPTWRKATPVMLKSEATVDDAMAIIMGACHAHWQANLAAAVDGRQIEGTHQVRVGLRRLRSALSLFKKFMPSSQRAALNGEAKWILTQLGPARDLDVFIQNLTAPLASRVADDAGLAQVIRVARQAQGKAHVAAAKALQSARTARFAARMDAWLTGRGWRTHDNAKRDGKAADFARKFLNRRLRNIRAEYNDIESLDTAARHELRIAVKKTRYGLEFFQSALPAKRARALAATLKHLQDNLGHLNDIDVADRTLSVLINAGVTGAERRQVASGGKIVSAWHKKAAKDAESETAKLWHKMNRVPAL